MRCLCLLLVLLVVYWYYNDTIVEGQTKPPRLSKPPRHSPSNYYYDLNTDLFVKGDTKNDKNKMVVIPTSKLYISNLYTVLGTIYDDISNDSKSSKNLKSLFDRDDSKNNIKNLKAGFYSYIELKDIRDKIDKGTVYLLTRAMAIKIDPDNPMNKDIKTLMSSVKVLVKNINISTPEQKRKLKDIIPTTLDSMNKYNVNPKLRDDVIANLMYLRVEVNR